MKKSASRSFFSGLGSVLVLGRCPTYQVPSNWSEALALDSKMLWEDFLPALAKLLNDVPPSRRAEIERLILKRVKEESCSGETSYLKDSACWKFIKRRDVSI